MFLNPLFYLFKHKSVARKVAYEEHVFRDTGQSYLLSREQLNASSTTTISLSQREWQVTESHLTVPQFQSAAEGFLGAYHHTLYLEGAQGAKYSVRIYFNRFDEICWDPRPQLRPIENEQAANAAPLDLSDRELDIIIGRFIVSSIDKIKYARHAQKIIVTLLLLQCAELENRIRSSALNSTEQLAAKEQLVEKLRELELYEQPITKVYLRNRSGTGFTDYATSIRRQVLEKSIAIAKRELAAKGHQAAGAGAAASSNDNEQPIIEMTASERQQAARDALEARRAEQLASEQQAANSFIADFEKTITTFRNAEKKNKDALLARLIQLDCRAAQFLEVHGINKDQLIKQQIHYQELISEYANDVNNENFAPHFRLCARNNIVNYITVDRVIILALSAIARGDSKLLENIMQHFSAPVLASLPMPVQLLPASNSDLNGKHYTLLEWSVALNNPSCFGVLLRAGHNPLQFTDANSPVKQVFTFGMRSSVFMSECITSGLFTRGGIRDALDRVNEIILASIVISGNESEDELSTKSLQQRLVQINYQRNLQLLRNIAGGNVSRQLVERMMAHKMAARASLEQRLGWKQCQAVYSDPEALQVLINAQEVSDRIFAHIPESELKTLVRHTISDKTELPDVPLSKRLFLEALKYLLAVDRLKLEALNNGTARFDRTTFKFQTKKSATVFAETKAAKMQELDRILQEENSDYKIKQLICQGHPGLDPNDILLEEEGIFEAANIGIAFQRMADRVAQQIGTQPPDLRPMFNNLITANNQSAGGGGAAAASSANNNSVAMVSHTMDDVMAFFDEDAMNNKPPKPRGK